MSERVFVEERPAKLLLETTALPAWLRDNPVLGLRSLALTSFPSFFQPDQVLPTWHGCPGCRSKKEAQDHDCVHTNLPSSAPVVCLGPGGLLFATLRPRLVAGIFKKRIMVRPEVQLPNSSIALNCYYSFNSQVLFYLLLF